MLILSAPLCHRNEVGKVQVSLREAADDFLHDLTYALAYPDVQAAFENLNQWLNYDADAENNEAQVKDHVNDATFDLQFTLAAAGCKFFLTMPDHVAERFARNLATACNVRKAG